MNLIQELYFEKVPNWDLGFLLKYSKGDSVFTPPTRTRGEDKGKQYVTFRETVFYSQKQKFPYMIGGKSGKTICGFRILDNFLGWSYTDINGYATILHTDFESFLEMLIFDAPKEKSFEVFSQYVVENKISQANKEKGLSKGGVIFELREPMQHFSYKNLLTVKELLENFENSQIVLNNKFYLIKSNGKLSKLGDFSKRERYDLKMVKRKYLEEVDKVVIDEFESECTVYFNVYSNEI